MSEKKTIGYLDPLGLKRVKDEIRPYYIIMTKEINTIQDEYVKSFALFLLDTIPEYFFTVPASSSGKYHPVTDLGEGGLVRHSISVKRMLEHLLVVQGSFLDHMPKYKDYLLVCALFHDSFKSGTQEMYEQNVQTKHLHPVYAAQFVVMSSVMLGFDYNDACFIADAIISHMGQWNKKLRDSGILPKPITPAQKVLHLADYLASRKDVNMDVGDDYVYEPDKEEDVSEPAPQTTNDNEKGE